ncbi:MAG: hypothetical protein SPJ09_00060 [Erysipelotrichaceae bacterium]|nr:hypothetical protein [Erysipelotrichaceae bacterium]
MNKLSKHWLVMIYMCGLSAAAIGVSANCLGVFYVPVSNALGVMRGTLTGSINYRVGFEIPSLNYRVGGIEKSKQK